MAILSNKCVALEIALKATNKWERTNQTYT